MHAYGDTLQAVLTKERAQLTGGALQLGQAIRLHPGKLRCDYLIWVASRPPHGHTEASDAPDLEAIERMAHAALALACKHGTLRVAFGAAGAGPKAADTAERLAALVRGADAFRAQRLQQGIAVPVEETLVCAPSPAEVAKARRLTARLAKQPTAAPVMNSAARTASASSARAGASSARSSGGASSARRGTRVRRLDPSLLEIARVRAEPYDRARSYMEGDWFVHPSFGTGQVQQVLGPERMVTALFEDGEERRLIHARV
jgi:O-acetyl-ADP-ribose deacetylase (regulator of RNase III)